MKRFLKPLVLYTLSALIPLIIMVVALIGLQVAPFGDKTLVISDANGLYINYLAYAGRMYRGLEGILYSFEKGLGGNMMPHIGGTMLNPFYFLFSHTDILFYPQAFTWVSVLNFSLCGLTMYVLLRYLYGHRLSNLIFSTSYALIGFNVANVFQVIFFTGVQALPIMVLGLLHLFKRKNPLPYILALAYSLVTSFYFGFTLCVFSFLLFWILLWYYHVELKGKKLSVFIHYCISSLLAGFLVCLVWLPAYLGLQGGRLDQTTLADFSFGENMPLLDIGSKLFSGANNTAELVNGLPNIFVGILPIALVILFFINTQIDRRRKTVAGILVGFYLASFLIVAFNMLMHGGTTTNWFNYRYSFIFSFILLIIASWEWQYLRSIPSQDLKKCLIVMVVSTILIFSKKHEYVMGGEVLLDFAVLFVIYGAYTMFRKDEKKNPQRTFELIAMVLVSVNLFCNYWISTYNIKDWGIKQSDYQKTVFQVDAMVKGIQGADHDFYRMEVNEQRSGTTGNDPMLYGYRGVGHGGSNERNFVREGLVKLGIPWYDMRNYYAEGVPAATDTLLGLRYIIAKEDIKEEKNYKKILGYDGIGLYKNEDALPLVFTSDGNLGEVETSLTNVFENLNSVWSTISGKNENVFTEIEGITFEAHQLMADTPISDSDGRKIVEDRDASLSAMLETGDSSSSQSDEVSENIGAVAGDLDEGAKGLTEPPENASYISYSWTASQDGPVYTYNRSALSEKHGSSTPALVYLGYYHKGDTVEGYISVSNGMIPNYLLEEVAGRFRAAYANLDVLAEMSQGINKQEIVLNVEKDSHFTAQVTADADHELLMTIPYDTGWTCLVDGVETEIKQVLGVFMAIDLPQGEHSVEMTFVPDGFELGKKISFAALIALVLYLTLGMKLLKASARKENELHEEAVTGSDGVSGKVEEFARSTEDTSYSVEKVLIEEPLVKESLTEEKVTDASVIEELKTQADDQGGDQP